jgi:ferritin-like metal-binding protein YciE
MVRPISALASRLLNGRHLGQTMSQEDASVNALRMLLIDELRDLLDAEKQLTRALPKMARAASTVALKTAFEQHLQETRGHVSRLERALALMKVPVRGKPCPGMKGLISEGQEMMGELREPPVRDAALIVSAQKVEHYEIAAYGSCKAFAGLLGEPQLAALLDQTLAEEKAADAKLSTLAEGEVNPKAEASTAEPSAEARGIFAQATEWIRGAVTTVDTRVRRPRVTRKAARPSAGTTKKRSARRPARGAKATPPRQAASAARKK